MVNTYTGLILMCALSTYSGTKGVMLHLVLFSLIYAITLPNSTKERLYKINLF